MDDELLERLLRGERLGKVSPGRVGADPGTPIRLADLAARIVECLERERWFPREWQPAVPGEPVHEGGTIERAGPHRYIYRTQRHHPTNPTLLAESTKRVFISGSRAARYYLRWDLNLPGLLGGYRVVK